MNDGRLVSATLQRQNFDVSEYFDADLKQLKRGLQAFFANAQKAGKDAVVFAFYADV